MTGLMKLTCSFNRKVHCWLRETVQKTNSAKSSSRNSKSISDKGSGTSRVSKNSHRSRSSKDINRQMK